MSDPDASMDVVELRYPPLLSSDYDHPKDISVMNYTALDELARQRQSELRDRAVRQRATAQLRRRQRPSLRVQTGWTLVDLGLKLAIPAHRRTATPSAIRS
jgi:hypothetical protein